MKGFSIFAVKEFFMSIKKYIPNLITLGNLFCGLLAITFVFDDFYELTLLFVSLGIFLDFFDGLFARILNVSGELGKQLDSLADMVTSAVVPALVMLKMLLNCFSYQYSNGIITASVEMFFPYLGFLLALGACYRLAKFNIDTRQTSSFIGLPTPAMSLFVVSLPVIQSQTEIIFLKDLLSNYYFLIAITFLLTFLMNANLPLFALKFKKITWKNNEFKFLLILISVALLILLKLAAIPLIILFYILLSVIKNMTSTKVETH